MTPFGAVYAGRQGIGHSIVCDFFVLRGSLKSRLGGIFTSDDTLARLAAPPRKEIDSHTCFASDPTDYRDNLLKYLADHMHRHAGQCNMLTDAFVSPFVKPVVDLWLHRKTHAAKSDVVFPQKGRVSQQTLPGLFKQARENMGGHIQTVEPIGKNGIAVIDTDNGAIVPVPRDALRLGCVMFIAAPAPF